MRRAAAVPVAASMLASAALTLTACSSHGPSLTGGTTLKVSTPALAAVKEKTDVPNCPRVASTPVAGGMPSVTVPCLGGGRSVDLAGLRGPMIVNFWQAYCGPCRQEMPALAAFARSHPGVKVLGIDYLDMQPAAALKLAGDSLVAYPLVADAKGDLTGKAPLTHIPGLPFTAFVAASGRVVHVEAVPMTSEQDVADAAKTYLGTSG
jgi:thiol-disulfide isomerase/thioredoxin